NLRALADKVIAFDGRAWGLTGTPLLNRPQELWHIFQTIGLAESAFGNWYSFVRLFGGHKGTYGWEWAGATDSDAVAMSIRRVALRRIKDEVLPDLPAKRRVHR